ncbi:hypothetical protein Scep_018380 [Stephania cephalantha]|uniref:xyloglucan:xyloglucosyl transferase n=1 Tax=Stephania cephalantha TaxID=152367 RepID=A0AAP0IT84_9MAGN
MMSLTALLIVAPGGLAAAPRTPVNVAFGRNYVPSWAFDHIKYFNGGNEIQLTLDKSTGTGFQSKGSYLFGHFSMQIKMVPGDSAGTVTAFYLSSQNSEHDEIDFEFLGNRSGQPYILQTNVFTGGKGDREQRIYLWFDPTTDYHSYSILWNLYQIVFLVDDVPIRIFKNCKDLGVKFPFNQPMKIYSSLWNADDWATRGGLEKTDWSKAPFVASYRGSTWMDARLPSMPSSATPKGRGGGTRRSSKTWTHFSTGDCNGSARNTPSTTTAQIGLDSPSCLLNARGQRPCRDLSTSAKACLARAKAWPCSCLRHDRARAKESAKVTCPCPRNVPEPCRARAKSVHKMEGRWSSVAAAEEDGDESRPPLEKGGSGITAAAAATHGGAS